MAYIGTYTKQPYEEVNITVDFSARMGTTETISTANVYVYDKGGTTDLASTMAGTPSISGQTVICLIKAGTDGNQYTATYRITTNASQKFEADVLIKAVETN